MPPLPIFRERRLLQYALHVSGCAFLHSDKSFFIFSMFFILHLEKQAFVFFGLFLFHSALRLFSLSLFSLNHRAFSAFTFSGLSFFHLFLKALCFSGFSFLHLSEAALALVRRSSWVCLVLISGGTDGFFDGISVEREIGVAGCGIFGVLRMAQEIGRHVVPEAAQ